MPPILLSNCSWLITCWREQPKGEMVFGLFKKRKSNFPELTDLISAAAEGESRATVNRALGSKGVQLAPEDDNSPYSIQASANIVRLIAREAGIPIGIDGNDDDNFVAGIFAFVVSNHISYMIGAPFEIVSSIVVMDLLGQDAASEVNDLADSYNRMSQEGPIIEAIGQNVAKWVSAPTDEQFSKIVDLYKLCRNHVQT